MKIGRYGLNRIYKGDALDLMRRLPDESIHCVACSPPYYKQRDYGDDLQWGREGTPREYIERLVRLGQVLRRKLRHEGTWWLNLGDGFSKGFPLGSSREDAFALKKKDLTGVPWRVALALQEDGWYLRQCVIWVKTMCAPESARDRPSCVHEYVFLLTREERYFYDYVAVREPSMSSTRDKYRMKHRCRAKVSKYDHGGGESRGSRLNRSTVVGDPQHRNLRSVWSLPTAQYPGGHFAVWPRVLVRPMVAASTSSVGVCANCGAPWARRPKRGWHATCGCRCRDVVPAIVVDPFAGSGTTGVEAIWQGRAFLGFDLNGGNCDHGGFSPNDRLRAAERRQPEPWDQRRQNAE